jgi:hypothetical protein
VALGDQPSKAGGLFCWGADDSGQLGRGSADPATGTNSAVAVQAAKFDNTARSILTAAGDGTTCTAKDPLELICGGLNDRLQAGAATAGPALEGLAVSLGGNLVTASSGGDFTCALVDVGVGAPSIGVKCWGGNASGQLGRDTAGAADGSPAYVTP